MAGKNLKLCGRCAAQMKEAFDVRKVSTGVNIKVKCESCKRTHYGGEYIITVK